MAKNPVTYAEVFRYLSGTSSEKYAEGCSEARKRSIRRFAVNFVLEEGILFYVKRENEKRRWIYDKHMQEQIIVSLHDDAAGGCHFGRDKTRDKVISRYYWHSQYEDVDNYVKTCERCQKVCYSCSKIVTWRQGLIDPPRQGEGMQRPIQPIQLYIRRNAG